MNATTIEAYALSKGIETSYAEMDNATKVGLAMEMFLEKTSKYAGNYAKENKTFAGSFTTLKASIQNFISGAGDIDDVIDSVMNFGEILIESIGNMAPKMVEGIIKLLNGVIPQIPTLLQRLLPTVIQGAVNLINGLVASLPTLIPVLMNGIVMAISQIVDVLPQIIESLLKATIMVIDALAEQMPVLLPEIIDAIIEIIPMLLDYLPLFLEAGARLIGAILAGLIIEAPKLLQKIPEIMSKIINTFTKLPEKMITIGVNILKGLWNGIQKQWGTLKNNIENLGDSIVKKFKAVFGIKSPSRIFRDEIGKQLSAGIGVGFEDELSNVYRDIQRVIDVEQSKLVASVETGRVFNTIQNSTPVAISVNGNVEMDSTKVGRLITPVVSKTIKTGGGM